MVLFTGIFRRLAAARSREAPEERRRAGSTHRRRPGAARAETVSREGRADARPDRRRRQDAESRGKTAGDETTGPEEGGRHVVKVTRLDGNEIVVNALLIETVEGTPDTVISLTTGRKLLVRDSVDEIIARVQEFHRAIGQPWAARGGNALEG